MDSYEVRAQSILERLRQMNRVEGESRLVRQKKQLEEMNVFESMVNNSRVVREGERGRLWQRLEDLKQSVAAFSKDAANGNKQVMNVIRHIEETAKEEIERHRRQQDLAEKHTKLVFYSKLDEMISIQKQLSNQKRQDIDRYEQIIQIQLPALLRQIRDQKDRKRETEQNTIDDVLSQLYQIKVMVEEEIKLQRQDQEQIINEIKSVNSSLSGDIKKERERQKKEEREIKGLLSSVLTRMKNEVLNEGSGMERRSGLF